MEKLGESSRAALIQEKKAQLRKVSDEILTLDKLAKKTNKQLLQEKEDKTAHRLSKSRVIMHNHAISNDRVLRPPDRENGIRTYGKMDLDVWKYDQIRDWFNQYGQPASDKNESPAETGYMILK